MNAVLASSSIFIPSHLFVDTCGLLAGIGFFLKIDSFQDSCLYLCVSWNSNFCVVTSPHPEFFCMKRLPKDFVSVSLFQVLEEMLYSDHAKFTEKHLVSFSRLCDLSLLTMGFIYLGFVVTRSGSLLPLRCP